MTKSVLVAGNWSRRADGPTDRSVETGLDNVTGPHVITQPATDTGEPCHVEDKEKYTAVKCRHVGKTMTVNLGLLVCASQKSAMIPGPTGRRFHSGPPTLARSTYFKEMT